MHDTGFIAGRAFIEQYWQGDFKKILDVGAIDVNGSLRQFTPKGAEFIGLDIVAGKSVDLVLDAPGDDFPLEDNSVDMVVSTSCFEHDQMFWHTFCEMVRVTKPTGFIYINVPSNGVYHSYPYDNWRFYPDSAIALVAWAKKQGGNPMLVESMTLRRQKDIWNDYVMIFSADQDSFKTPRKMLSDTFTDAMNIRRFDREDVQNFTVRPEDMQLHQQHRKALAQAGK